MKNHMKTILSLSVICAVIAILLACTNYITAPIIEQQEQAAVQLAMAEVLPTGEDFQLIDHSGKNLPESITEVYLEKNGGYVFKMTTAGYASGFVVLCGIDADGKVTGATYITSNETLGAEKEYGSNLIGASADTIDAVDTVAGATRTTLAYRNAIKDALDAAKILKGDA